MHKFKLCFLAVLYTLILVSCRRWSSPAQPSYPKPALQGKLPQEEDMVSVYNRTLGTKVYTRKFSISFR